MFPLHVYRISPIKYNITRAENTKERKDHSDSDVNELLGFKFKVISCQKLQSQVKAQNILNGLSAFIILH